MLARWMFAAQMSVATFARACDGDYDGTGQTWEPTYDLSDLSGVTGTWQHTEDNGATLSLTGTLEGLAFGDGTLLTDEWVDVDYYGNVRRIEPFEYEIDIVDQHVDSVDSPLDSVDPVLPVSFGCEHRDDDYAPEQLLCMGPTGGLFVFER